jgi:hypothetical protein
MKPKLIFYVGITAFLLSLTGFVWATAVGGIGSPPPPPSGTGFGGAAPSAECVAAVTNYNTLDAAYAAELQPCEKSIRLKSLFRKYLSAGKVITPICAGANVQENYLEACRNTVRYVKDLLGIRESIVHDEIEELKANCKVHLPKIRELRSQLIDTRDKLCDSCDPLPPGFHHVCLEQEGMDYFNDESSSENR